MQQNKLIWVLMTLIVILIVTLGFKTFQNKILEKELDSWGRLVNNLNLERDFEIYAALKENNITRVGKNLELNFMFHLTAIETDGIVNVLYVKYADILCKKYNIIKTQFKNEYENKYPSSIKDLNLFCKPK